MVISADSFYEVKPWVEVFKIVLAFEMECSVLFVQCSVKGLRSGAIIAMDEKAGDIEAVLRYARGESIVHEVVKREIEIALEAIKLLEGGHSFT